MRGNAKIMQELESVYRGAGWNVIKVVWGGDWDALLAQDHDGRLRRRMMECVDGEYQVFKARGGAYSARAFLRRGSGAAGRVAHLSDEQIGALHRGGHDPAKVYAAYAAALRHTGRPTVILAKTVKGYGMGAAGEAANTNHQQKKMADPAVRSFRDRYSIRCPTISWSRFRTSSRRPAAPSRPISTRPSSARAAICRAVRPAPARWPRRRWRPSPRCSRAARAASSRPRWPSCGCWASC